MQIHISRDGQSFGPYTQAEVQNYLSTGHIKSTDLAWYEGVAEWQPLHTLPGFENLPRFVPPVIPGAHEPQAEYHHVSFTKFIIFSICSFGIYDLYWFYKNWKFIRDRDNLDISPFWRMFFSPFWCYSLARDINQSKGDLSTALPAIVAGVYFVLSITWRLPDPYWLFSTLTFVPLLYIVWQIDQLNRSKSLRSNYYSRFKIRHIIACFIGALMVLFSTASTLNMIPSTQVVEGDRLPADSVNYLRKAEIVPETESVLYFYSTGMFSIEDDGNLITTKRVISYEKEPESGELEIYSAEYKDIKDIEITPAESALDDTLVFISLDEEDGFYLLLSAEEGRDKLFTDKLMALWNEHKPKETAGTDE